jgi:hypothetical protein
MEQILTLVIALQRISVWLTHTHDSYIRFR